VRTLGSYLLNRPFALGVSDESVYVTEEDMVQSGDLILLFTDGLCDLGEGKDLTPEDPRFLGLVQNCIHQHGEAFLDALLAESRLFSGQDHFLDDVCLIGVEVEYLQGRS
jgi:serine phosphatase RsbU (regulator of sigma subunit)